MRKKRHSLSNFCRHSPSVAAYLNDKRLSCFKKKIDNKCFAKCFIFLKKFKSNQALLQDVFLCYRWILITSFGIPPKIKWAIIVYDLSYCSVVYVQLYLAKKLQYPLLEWQKFIAVIELLWLFAANDPEAFYPHRKKNT